MKKRKILWARVWCAMGVVLLAFTPLFVIWANQTRAVKSVGGEAIIWLYPMIFAAISYAKEQDRKEQK